MAPRANLTSIHQPGVTLKLCGRCGNVNPTRPGRSCCILCQNAGVRAWAARQDPQAVAKKNRTWRETNKTQYLAQRRSYYEASWLHVVLYQARLRAKRKGIPFDITEGDIEVPEVCPVLGMRLEMAVGAVKDNSPSLDRIDPVLGYVRGNVVVLSHRANRIKSDGTADEHERVAAWLRSRRGD